MSLSACTKVAKGTLCERVEAATRRVRVTNLSFDRDVLQFEFVDHAVSTLELVLHVLLDLLSHRLTRPHVLRAHHNISLEFVGVLL